METKDYKYYQLPFKEFNTAQKAVVPFFDKDVNLVCSLNTGVGKTAIAECIFAYHLSMEDDCKVIYVSPYKSIGSEKLKSWEDNLQFRKYGILLCNSDTKSTPEDWKSKKIIVITYESFDLKVKNKNTDWLDKVKCVVFDESHMLGQEGRGHTIESSLIHFTDKNKKARIVFLSGTMGNSIELAKWIKFLNQKETKCVISDWKPVRTIINYHEYDDSGSFKQSEKDKLDTLYNIINKKHKIEKIVIFVHSKRMGKVIVDFLRKKKITTAFHNSSLGRAKREELEALFKDDTSDFRVLVSTSTLSTGTNLGQ